MRAFIAIELNPEAKAALRALQKQLVDDFAQAKLSRALRWVHTDGIHVTLRFLGETSEAEHLQMARHMRSIAGAHKRFALSVSGVGCFPNLNRPAVLWAGVQGDLDPLRALQADLEDAARAEGFKPETRPFSPHLTLARVARDASPDALPGIGEVIRHSAASPAVAALHAGIPVTEIVFFQSDLRPDGAVYTALTRESLK